MPADDAVVVLQSPTPNGSEFRVLNLSTFHWDLQAEQERAGNCDFYRRELARLFNDQQVFRTRAEADDAVEELYEQEDTKGSYIEYSPQWVSVTKPL